MINSVVLVRRIMISEKNIHFILTLLILVWLVGVSIPFQTPYAASLRDAANQPLAKFLAGALIVFTAAWSPVLAGLLLLVVFLWISDIQLLSTF